MWKNPASELPMGVSLRAILYDYAGGILGGKKLKAVMPGDRRFRF
jgi:NADH:ubiquinone oxidoreductase subunit F (NADH-binding)